MSDSIRQDPRIEPLLKDIDPYYGGLQVELSNLRRATELLIKIVDEERATNKRITEELKASHKELSDLTRCLEYANARIPAYEIGLKNQDEHIEKLIAENESLHAILEKQDASHNTTKSLAIAIKSRNRLIEILRQKMAATYDHHAEAVEARRIVLRPQRLRSREHPYQAEKLTERFEAMRIAPDAKSPPGTWVPDLGLLRIRDAPTEQPSQDLE